MTAVPLVDLAPWCSADPAARRQVATDVDRALCEVGSVLVTGHPVGAAVGERVREEVGPFFALPTPEKAQLACFPGGRGWVPPPTAPPDLRESFAFGPERVPPAVLGTPEEEWFSPNSWPAALPGLQPAATAYAAACAALADDLLRVLALALDLPDGFFVERCRENAWSVAVDAYPARQLCGAERTDVGTLTVREPPPGWQVRNADGAWVDPPRLPGAVTVTAGELLARWTGDRWRAAPHRVLAPPGLTERQVSLAYSHAPDPLTVVERLPSAAAGPTRYEPVITGQFLRRRMHSITVGWGRTVGP
jgi:isopenicillin N synthase-like dioxygenase